ncbi:MAG: RluA family pseudouridine synthase [Bacteroidota bacterium]
MKKTFIHFKDLILHEDDAIVLVNKPGEMASLDDKSNRNLNHLAKQYHPDLSLCHRLDKNTSGILLLAKGADHYRTIAMQFEKRQIRKTYLTLAAGVHHFTDHTIDLPLYVSTKKKVSVNKGEGKKATTIVDTIDNFRNFTLLQCQPISGRMHQIRVHLAAVGCPIVGDELYGGRDILLSEIKRKYKVSGRKMEERPINHGYLLHAQKLSFQHPASGEQMTVEAEIPKNFAVSLKVLEKYDRN